VSNRNKQVAAAFEELADLLELSGAQRFKVLAYRRAAVQIEAFGRDLAGADAAELASLPGIGKATLAKIEELLATGSMQQLEEARLLLPPGLRDITRLSGVGPRRAMLLNAELGISSLDELQAAISAQKLRKVKGLGAKTEENIARALKLASAREGRVTLDIALAVAESLTDQLNSSGTSEQVTHAGSLRRMRETIGDIDLLSSSNQPAAVMDAFVGLAGIETVKAHGETKSSGITMEGLQVDLRVVAPSQFGAALQYFTGSKDHNVKVREHAVKMSLKLSEYGLFKVDNGDLVAGETEEEVYAALGLQTPLPTMREDRGEFELARRFELPAVVTLPDIKGDLHNHTRYSDGLTEVDQMVSAARQRGYSYLAITDHARANHVLSHTIDSVLHQREEIDRLNRDLLGEFIVLQGVEMDILPDGQIDLPQEILDVVDLVIVSIHTHFELPRAQMTKRVLTALAHPAVNIFGHPTGRRLGSRPPVDFDLEEVLNSAKHHRVAMEVNSTPTRLDLRDEHIRVARQVGCLFSIDTDSHSPSRLDRMQFGVATAQRGWLEPKDVINTWPLDELRTFLAKKRG